LLLQLECDNPANVWVLSAKTFTIWSNFLF
jgi:hypothetical protein